MNPDQILAEADRCVKCGLCLPHCPTYRITRDEGDSPRGRIALMQALAGQQVDSASLHRHLDRCLGCLNCESACPSKVNYGLLIDSTRSLQAKQRPRFSHDRLFLLTRLPYLRGSRALLRFYQLSGLKKLLGKIAGDQFRRLNNLLPSLPNSPRLAHHYGTEGRPIGRVGLFTGCIGRITDQPALLASIRILTRLGFDVLVPEAQRCCGALHQHNGQPAVAAQLAAENCREFNSLRLDAVVHVASGCGVQLADYATIGEGLKAPVSDICSFLTGRGLLDTLPLSPLKRRVMIHHPCSSRRLAGATANATRLLQKIPGIELQTIRDTGCCGAAGSYLLLQPEMADRLRQPIVEQVREGNGEILVTGNTGCALHLAAGLGTPGNGIEVMHPVQLLARQLQ